MILLYIPVIAKIWMGVFVICMILIMVALFSKKKPLEETMWLVEPDENSYC